MALAVPLSRFTSRVGGGSAFFVRLLTRIEFMITPKLAVQYIQGEPENRHKEIHEFVVSATAGELLEAVCLIDQFPPAIPAREWQARIGMALNARIAQEAAESARKLERYTRWLIGLTIVLAVIAFLDFAEKFCHVTK